MRKTDIINALAKAHGLRSYLEICTPTAGFRFGAIDRTLFDRCDRLVYLCSDDFSDGQPITYRSPRGRSDDAIAVIRGEAGAGRPYDIIFVDAHHTYANSICDLWAAYSLLSPGGVLVAHDCNPHRPEAIAPIYQDGPWCGRSFQAFIDFTLGAPNSGTCVIDTDHGCGIVFGVGAQVPAPMATVRMSDRLAYEWAIAKASDQTLYPFFHNNRRDLLNLLPAAVFARSYDLPEPGERASRPSVITRVRGHLARRLAPRQPHGS